MSRKYHIALFLDDNETAVVPDEWLQGEGLCVWPSFKSQQRINNAVQKSEVPGDSWKSYEVRTLYTGKIFHSICFSPVKLPNCRCTTKSYTLEIPPGQDFLGSTTPRGGGFPRKYYPHPRKCFLL